MIEKWRPVIASGMMSAAIGGLLLTTATPASAAWRAAYHGPYPSFVTCDASRHPSAPPDTYVDYCYYHATDPDQQGPDRGPGWYFAEWYNTEPPSPR